jgi:hypothetical protein
MKNPFTFVKELYNPVVVSIPVNQEDSLMNTDELRQEITNSIKETRKELHHLEKARAALNGKTIAATLRQSPRVAKLEVKGKKKKKGHKRSAEAIRKFKATLAAKKAAREAGTSEKKGVQREGSESRTMAASTSA